MALPTLDATFASAADLPRRQMLAKWLVNLQYSGSIEDYWTLPEHYLWAKIAVAAGAPRSEADYISLPKNYVWSDLYNAVSGSSGQTIDRGEKEAIGWIAAAVRGDAGNPEAVANYINWPWRYQVASIITALAVDADAQSFITTSGATDVQGVDKFVKGVKNLGLWDSMVCWPLRSSQNAGSGNTVYSLGGLGTYNGTRVDDPTWGSNGITVTSTKYITDGLGAPVVPASIVVAGRRVAGTGTAAWQYISSGSSRSLAKRMYANNSAGLSIASIGYIMQVDTDAQTLSSDFEVVTGIVPTSTNSEAEVYINATKPAQTAGATSWGASASTGGTLQASLDGQFEASMHAVFSTAINAKDFYALYKSTLGNGLGLP